MKMALAVLLALSVPASVYAQDQAREAGSAAGRSLGGLIGSIMNRQSTYDREYQRTQSQMLEQYVTIQEARRAQQEADLAILLKQVRTSLEEDWQKAGFDADQAHAMAQAYVFAPDDEAVFMSVRGIPAAEVGTSIRKAIADRNFRLANQLLLGGLIAMQSAQAQQ